MNKLAFIISVVILFASIYAQWNTDVFKSTIGNAVFEDSIIEQCLNKKFKLADFKVIINASEVELHMPLSLRHNFSLFVEQEAAKATAQLKDYFDKRCSSRDKRGLGSIINSGVKVFGKFQKGTFAKKIWGNKGSILFNTLSLGLGVVELSVGLSNAKDIEAQKTINAGFVKEMEKFSSQFSSELSMIAATSLVKANLWPVVEELKGDINLLLVHGKIVGVAQTPERTLELLRHEISLETCSTEDSTVHFKECRVMTSKENIYPLVQVMHLGTFNEDRSIFSRINFNKTNVEKNGILTPVNFMACSRPQKDSFLQKVFICLPDSIIHAPCSPDSVDYCTIESIKTNGPAFFQYKVVDRTYLIATGFKAFTLVNTTSGDAKHIPITCETFTLSISFDSYAMFGIHKLIGLRHDSVVELIPRQTVVQVELDSWQSSDTFKMYQFYIKDVNKDGYPDDKILHVEKSWSIIMFVIGAGVAAFSIGAAVYCYCCNPFKCCRLQNKSDMPVKYVTQLVEEGETTKAIFFGSR